MSYPYLNPKELKEGNLYEIKYDWHHCFDENQIFYFIKKQFQNGFEVCIVLTKQGITKFLFYDDLRFKLLN